MRRWKSASWARAERLINGQVRWSGAEIFDIPASVFLVDFKMDEASWEATLVALQPVHCEIGIYEETLQYIFLKFIQFLLFPEVNVSLNLIQR